MKNKGTQQERIDNLIKEVGKHKWSSKPVTVESGMVKTYAKMYDLEPIRVAAIFNEYQKGKFAKGGDIEDSITRLFKRKAELSSYSDEKIAKLYSNLKGIDYNDLLIELKGNKAEREDAINELIKEYSKTPKMAKGGGIDNKPKITMNNLDWGKTTYERNSNLDKYNSLKTDAEKFNFLKELKSKNESNKFAKGGDIDSKSSYEAMLRKYDQLGAYLEDAIEDNKTSEVTRLKSEMSALETKINNYERGGNSFSYSIGGL